MSASLNVPATTERQKLNKKQRESAVIALKSNGLNHQEIAAELGLDRRTVGRYVADLKPAQDVVERAVEVLNAQIAKHITVESRAKKYASLAKDAKNEAVSLGALQRIDDLAGIVTEKELVRSKRNDVPDSQPMFVLPAGAMISVTVGTTTCSVSPANIDRSDGVINVTPLDPTKP